MPKAYNQNLLYIRLCSKCFMYIDPQPYVVNNMITQFYKGENGCTERYLAHDHTVHKWQSLGSNPGSLSALSSPGGSDGKASACNVRDLGSIPLSGGSPGEGNGNPLQYSCLENSMDGGVWQAIYQSMGLQRVGHD